MSDINYKEFMDRVQKRINSYSIENLREIIYQWAKQIPSKERNEFLLKITPTSKEVGLQEDIQNNANFETDLDDGILEELEDFKKRVEDGSYCDGWGWDHEIEEERDWGDESWVEEIDDFFNYARELLEGGNPKIARDAYSLLFIILFMAENPGHLPGTDPWEMVETNLDEARARYFHAIYLSSTHKDRPQELYEGMQEFNYFDMNKKISLTSILNISIETLPDFQKFLTLWISFLNLKKEKLASHLLREATKLQGGIPALASLANNDGIHHPKVYLDWIDALEQSQDYLGMVEAANKGLLIIPKDYIIRAKIAEGLIKSGQYLGDMAIQLKGWREAFFSDPSLGYFLPLLKNTDPKVVNEDIIPTVITRIQSLMQKDRNDNSIKKIDRSGEENLASASLTLLCQVYLFTGNYQEAIDVCSKSGPLGWTSCQNPKSQIIPFFLKLLYKNHSSKSPNLDILWKWTSENCHQNSLKIFDNNKGEWFKDASTHIFDRDHTSKEEQERYLQWCIKEIENRVNSIVTNKYRYSYHKAANLLISILEVLKSRGKKAQGIILIEKFKNKYSRHRAFQDDLKTALALN